MKDSFDEELRRALQESTSLKGWEFTPAMKARVLDRIRQEEAAPDPRILQDGAPAGRGRRSGRRTARILGPLAATAAAAALIAIAMNTDIPGFETGSRGKGTEVAHEAPPQKDAAVQEAAPMTLAAPEDSAVRTESAPEPTAPFGFVASVPPDARSAASNESEAASNERQDASTESEVASDQSDPPVTTLALLPPSQDETDLSQDLAAATVFLDPSVLDGREMLAYGEEPVMKLMSVAAEKQALQALPPGDAAVELTASGLRLLSPNGEEIWSRPVEGVAWDSQLAVSGDGRIAVVSDQKLQVYSATGGNLEWTADAVGSASRLLWGPGERLAVMAGSEIRLFREGELVQRLDRPGAFDAAYQPDGSLALLSIEEEGTTLDLLAADSDRKARSIALPPDAIGPVVTVGDKVMVGPLAYSSTGEKLWRLPISPVGIEPVRDQKLMIAWDAERVLAVRTEDGEAVWQAVSPDYGLSKAVASSDGQFVAMLTADAAGSAVWVLDRNGKLIFSERLSDHPGDVTILGDRLLLLTENGVEVRSILHQ